MNVQTLGRILLSLAACGALGTAAPAQAQQVAGASRSASGGASSAEPHATRASPYKPERFSGRAAIYYSGIWGIDSISVKLVESGELIRFSYRVLDPVKAAPLNSKLNTPTLEDPKAGVSVIVPTMEQVGQLRQAQAPEAGRSYWMTFSNKGRHVARGDRVDVVIGPFRGSNLVVD